jgi:hypothetical protein
VAVLLLEVVEGLIATLPAAIFLSIVVGVLGNFWCLFIFRGSSPYVPFLRVYVVRVIRVLLVLSCPYSPSNVLRVLFYVLMLSL